MEKGFFAAKGMTDFDIGVGWQTWGNYGSVSKWFFNYYSNQRVGDFSQKYFVMVMITVFGFYLRIYLSGPEGKEKLWSDTE